MKVLRGHPGIVDDPEPLVLAETLGASTVNLRIYFWIDILKFSQLKVRSAVIRLVKRAFIEGGISMPDEAREVVFPNGVPVNMITEEPALPAVSDPAAVYEDAEVSNDGEGGLDSEAVEIQSQARASRNPEEGTNLIE